MTTDPDIKERIARVLAAEIAPALGMDGGTIEVVDVEAGVARIRLGGSCGCCPHSVFAVVMMVEEELRRRVPGVEYLEVVP